MTTHTYDKKPKLPDGLVLEEGGEVPPLPSGLELESSKKKVGGEEPQYTFPTTVSEVLSTGKRKTSEDEKNKFIKPLPPQTFQQGVLQDKKEANSYWGGVYNMIVGGVASAAGGVADFINTQHDAFLDRYDKENGNPVGFSRGLRDAIRKTDQPFLPPKPPEGAVVENIINKARSASSSRENEEARSHLDITDGISKDDFKALLFIAPKTAVDMGMGALTGGQSFFYQSVRDNNRELEESGMADALTPNEKMLYLTFQGGVQAALEKFGLDKVLKSTGISSSIKSKIANKIADELIKKGGKVTADQIEKLAVREASSLASQIKKVGVKGLTSFGYEGGTEATQSLASDDIKLLTNKLVGSKIFDEDDIKANFFKNAINSGAIGGVFGGGAGSAVGVMSNTKKAIRKEVAKIVTKEDHQKIQQKVNEQVELGNITPQEAEAANITAQQYAEIAAKIPSEVDAEKKYALIGGIEQREDLKKEIQNATQELASTDEAFHEPIRDRIELYNAKLEQTNDYIDGLVAGKKFTYKKDGAEFFKTDAEGNEIPISKLHYELATAIREQDAINNKKPEISPDDQKTFEFDADEDVPTELEKTQPIAIRETEGGKIEATYSGEQLVKAGLATKPKELTEIQAAKILAKIPSLNDIDQAMADENPIGMVKFIAEQSNGGRRKDMIEQGFPESVINEAVKAFPPTTEDVVPSSKYAFDKAFEGIGKGIDDALIKQVKDGTFWSQTKEGAESLANKLGDNFEVVPKKQTVTPKGKPSFEVDGFTVQPKQQSQKEDVVPSFVGEFIPQNEVVSHEKKIQKEIDDIETPIHRKYMGKGLSDQEAWEASREERNEAIKNLITKRDSYLVHNETLARGIINKSIDDSPLSDDVKSSIKKFFFKSDSSVPINFATSMEAIKNLQDKDQYEKLLKFIGRLRAAEEGFDFDTAIESTLSGFTNKGKIELLKENKKIADQIISSALDNISLTYKQQTKVSPTTGSTVYHGGEKVLNEGDLSNGVMYFSSDRGFAEGYSQQRHSQKKPKITEATITINNPAPLDVLEKVAKDLGHNRNEHSQAELAELKGVKEKLQEMGYDGVRGAMDFGFRSDFEEVPVDIVFDAKNQVKIKSNASPTTEQATKEVLNIPKNFKEIQDTYVEVRNSDGTKTKTKFKRAFVDLKKQFKQLDNVLKCI